MVNAETNMLRQRAAERAAELVESGMVVGLGTGNTANFFIRILAERLNSGAVKDIIGIPTSVRTEREAQSLNIPLGDLNDHPVVDITIDGADEVDPDLNLIKGGGGALLREKIVAQTSRQEVIIIDDFKLVPKLGTNWAVPIEVVTFGWRSQALYLESLGAVVTFRTTDDGQPFVTDQGNYILDCKFGAIADPYALAASIKSRGGIVEHGLFLGLATEVIVASNSGIRRISRTALGTPIQD